MIIVVGAFVLFLIGIVVSIFQWLFGSDESSKENTIKETSFREDLVSSEDFLELAFALLIAFIVSYELNKHIIQSNLYVVCAVVMLFTLIIFIKLKK